jgi:hypothetical protein
VINTNSTENGNVDAGASIAVESKTVNTECAQGGPRFGLRMAVPLHDSKGQQWSTFVTVPHFQRAILSSRLERDDVTIVDGSRLEERSESARFARRC